MFVGTRPLSLGGAFVAVADDGNAMFWNPAGLAHLERIQLDFAYADLFGLDIDHLYLSFFSRFYFIPPLTDYLSFGLAWSGIHYADMELATEKGGFDFGQDQLNFSLAFRPPREWHYFHHLGIGASAKYLQVKGGLDGQLEADARGWGLDLGLIYDLGELPYVPKGLNLGFMVHDVGGSRVKHETGVREKILFENRRWGFSYRPFEIWRGGKVPVSYPIVALDFDDRIHLGVEFWLANTLAVRAGVQKSFDDDEKTTFSFGLGFKASLKDWPAATLDYALTDSPVLPNTNRQFGGSLIIKENPRLIRIRSVHMDDVFASLYPHYGLAGSGIGRVKLENVSPDTMKVWISFLADRYMKHRAADTLIVKPRDKDKRPGTVDYQLRAAFEPEILDARQRRLTGKVKITYAHRKLEHSTIAAVDFTLHGKNYLTWDDPGKAAAFVTATEPRVKAFVDKVRGKMSSLGEPEQWFSRYRMGEALALFDALQAYGVDYRLDPVTPFPSLADTRRGAGYRLDTIKYPAELLGDSTRFGDCDDLSVLYASLLQYAGLSTALVSGPGHVFMMFDTHIDTSYQKRLPVSPKLFKKRNGTLWIPIETTMLPDSSFTSAWRAAADTLGETDDDSTWQVFEVAVCQTTYQPVNLGIDEPLPSEIPDFTAALQKDKMGLNNLKDQYLSSFEDSLRRDLPPFAKTRIRNNYAAVLGQNDEYDRAREQFKKINAEDSTYAPAWNNLGNVEFMNGDFRRAEALYLTALRQNEFSRGTYLNLAMLYQMMIDGASPQDSIFFQSQSDKMLQKAAQRFEGNDREALAVLHIPFAPDDFTKAGVWDNLKQRMRRAKDYIDKGFKMLFEKKEIKGVVFDRSLTKRRGFVDPEWGALLSWAY